MASPAVQLTFDWTGVDSPDPAPVQFVQVCHRCGVAFDLGTVMPGDTWQEPVLFGYVALATHQPLCLGPLTPPCLVPR